MPVKELQLTVRIGGKKFSRDLQPLDKDGNPLGMWRDPKDKIQEESSDEDEDSSSEEESDDGGQGSSKVPESEMTREQRREAAKKRKQAAIAKKNKKVAEVGDMPSDSEEESEDDEDMPANPNHTAKARNQARAATGPPSEDAPKKVDKENLSRREREAIQAQQAKERYQKLHAEGKTDEARADLARLRLIREQREAAAARKAAEKEEEDARASANKEKLEKERAKRDAAMGPAAKKTPAASDTKKTTKGKK